MYIEGDVPCEIVTVLPRSRTSPKHWESERVRPRKGAIWYRTRSWALYFLTSGSTEQENKEYGRWGGRGVKYISPEMQRRAVKHWQYIRFVLFIWKRKRFPRRRVQVPACSRLTLDMPFTCRNGGSRLPLRQGCCCLSGGKR